MNQPSELLGIGLYSLPDAAHILRVRQDKVRRWVKGYTFAVEGHRKPSSPLIRAELGMGREITFRDLMELKFISLFHDSGVSLQYIRAAAAALAREFGTDHPLSAKRFDTDGSRIFLTVDRAATGLAVVRYTREATQAQLCFEQAVKPFFLQLGIEHDDITQWWPLGPEGRVVLDPQRSFGHPVDAESGVPTAILYQQVKMGESEESVAFWYEVPVDAVRQAVRYEKALAA